MAFPGGDGYYEIAENLLQGNGFSRDVTPPFAPDSVRTPLYPLFVAGLVALFKSYYAVLVAQILLGSVIPLLGYVIAREVTEQRRLALVVATLLAIEPFSIQLSTTIRNEILFTVLFLAGLTLFLMYWKNPRWHTLAGSSLLLAFATLSRPTIQYLPFLIAVTVLYLLRKQKARAILHASLFGAVFLIVLSPWMLRNYTVFHNPALSVQYASVPYGYLIPSIIALEENTGFEAAKRKFYAGEGDLENFENITLINASYYQKRTLEFLSSHPSGLLQSTLVTIVTFFTHDGYFDVLRRLVIAPSIQLERPVFIMLLESPEKTIAFITPLLKSPALFVILGRMLWVLISLCFIIGAVKFLKAPEHRAKGVFVLLIIAYFVLTTIAVGLSVNARFRMPVNAFILMFAVYGAYELLSSIKTFVHKKKRVEAL